MRWILVFMLLIGGCSAPTKFEVGDEVSPPYGCIEYRHRGGRC